MYISQLIKAKYADFLDLCKVHKVAKIYLFGSSVSGDFDIHHSDVDLLVEINEADPLEKGEILLSLWDQLEFFFDRKVDLLTEDSLKNPYLKNNIEKTKRLIYDGQRKEVFV